MASHDNANRALAVLQELPVRYERDRDEGFFSDAKIVEMLPPDLRDIYAQHLDIRPFCWTCISLVGDLLLNRSGLNRSKYVTTRVQGHGWRIRTVASLDALAAAGTWSWAGCRKRALSLSARLNHEAAETRGEGR